MAGNKPATSAGAKGTAPASKGRGAASGKSTTAAAYVALPMHSFVEQANSHRRPCHDDDGCQSHNDLQKAWLLHVHHWVGVAIDLVCCGFCSCLVDVCVFHSGSVFIT
jgi:hypothetical protein